MNQPSSKWRDSVLYVLAHFDDDNLYETLAPAVRNSSRPLRDAINGSVNAIRKRMAEKRPFSPREMVELSAAFHSLQALSLAVGALPQNEGFIREASYLMRLLQESAVTLSNLFPDEVQE